MASAVILRRVRVHYIPDAVWIVIANDVLSVSAMVIVLWVEPHPRQHLKAPLPVQSKIVTSCVNC